MMLQFMPSAPTFAEVALDYVNSPSSSFPPNETSLILTPLPEEEANDEDDLFSASLLSPPTATRIKQSVSPSRARALVSPSNGRGHVSETAQETGKAEDEDEEEHMRPASPKHEESYMSTLSYFLPNTPVVADFARTSRTQLASPSQLMATQARLPHVSSSSSSSSSLALSSLSAAVHPAVTPASSPRRNRMHQRSDSLEPLHPSKRLRAIAEEEVKVDTRHSSHASSSTSTHAQFNPAATTTLPSSPLEASSRAFPLTETTPLASLPFAREKTNSSMKEPFEEAQHLTLFNLEIHCHSRRSLLPDPERDPLCALVWSARWLQHGAESQRTLSGVLLWPHLPKEQTQAEKSKGQQQSDGETVNVACPPLPLPRDVTVRVVQSELELLEALVLIVRRVDPDIIYSYEVHRQGLGYVIERANKLGVSLAFALGRNRERAAQFQKPSAQRAPEMKRSNFGRAPEAPAPIARDVEEEEHEEHADDEEEVEQRADPRVAATDAAEGDEDAGDGDARQQAPSEVASAQSENAAERYDRNHGTGIYISGRVVINLWRLMRDDLKLNIYTFENVAAHVLGIRFARVDHQVLTTWWISSLRAWNGLQRRAPGSGDCWRVLDHVLQRSLHSFELIERLDLIGRTSELARVFGLKFMSVINRGSQFRVESMMLRMTRPHNFVLPSLSPEQRASQPAMEALPMILEPVSQFYTSPVVVLDFQSLYPSMMIAYNICYSTCLGKLPSLSSRHAAAAMAAASSSSSSASCGPSSIRTGLGGLSTERASNLLAELLDQGDDSIWISPSSCMFVRSQIRRGILPQLLSEILQTRIMVKKAMKRPEIKADRAATRLHNARQFALKLISNVTYGYTAAGFSGRMPCAEIADAIVSTARHTLERAIELVHKHPTWRARVVYGDTDSLFVHLEGRTREDAFVIGAEIAKAVTAANPRPVQLQMDKVYHPCMLIAKKRYVGLKFDHAKMSPEQAVLDCKGLEMVRRDGCGLLVKLQEQTLQILFRTRDVSAVRTNMENLWHSIFTGRVSVQDCIFASEVRLGTYRVLPRAAFVAESAMKKDVRTAPLYGERVEYVVVDGHSDSVRIRDKAVPPAELLANTHRMRICSWYYIEKQLIRPMERLLILLGISIYNWYREWPKPRVRKYMAPILDADAMTGPGVGGIKRTIEHYFPSQHCPICDRTVDGASGICRHCLASPVAVTVNVMSAHASTQERVAMLIRICRSCMDHGYIGHDALAQRRSARFPFEIECTSRDCPVLFARHRVRDELREVHDLRSMLERAQIKWKAAR